MKKCLALFCLLSSGAALAASFAPIFQENMVVQRDVTLPIWGKAKPHESLSISWQGKTKTIKADASGTWRVSFPASPANSNPSTLTLKDESATTSLSNILIGDVWLASGQSNMEWPMHKFTDGSKDYVGFDNKSLRLMSMDLLQPMNGVPYQLADYDAAEKAGFVKMSWKLCNPDNVKTFSATASYFARSLQEELKVPVAVICNAIGGAPMEAFLPADLIEKEPRFAHLRGDAWLEANQLSPSGIQNWAKAELQILLKERSNVKHPFKPSFIYDYSLVPILPFPIKGVIWYQGESNAQVNNQEQNALLLQSLISSWRKAYGNDKLPFYMVQLPRFNSKSAQHAFWAQFREVQQRVADEMEGVELICAFDLGMTNADIHPSPKGPVGRRLSALALYHSYGKQEAKARGVSPRITAVEWEGKSAKLTLSAAIKCNDGKEMRGFVYLFADKKSFAPLQGKLADDGKSILLDLPEQPQQGAEIRYIYNSYAEPNLVSVEGELPLFPWKKVR